MNGLQSKSKTLIKKNGNNISALLSAKGKCLDETFKTELKTPKEVRIQRHKKSEQE